MLEKRCGGLEYFLFWFLAKPGLHVYVWFLAVEGAARAFF
jgi:hypothetical protein